MSANGKTDHLDLTGVFEVGDLLFMIESLRTAHVRAAISSSEAGRAVSLRLDAILRKLAAMCPLPKGEDLRGNDWFVACRAAATCSSYLVYHFVEKRDYGGSLHHMDAVVDGSMFRLVKSGDKDQIVAALERVNGIMGELSPLTAERMRMISGAVDVGVEVVIPAEKHFDLFSRARFKGLSDAMSAHLMPVSSVVHVVEGSVFWRGKTIVEVRFAVPASCVEAVMAHVGQGNAQAASKYAHDGNSGDFTVTVLP